MGDLLMRFSTGLYYESCFLYMYSFLVLVVRPVDLWINPALP